MVAQNSPMDDVLPLAAWTTESGVAQEVAERPVVRGRRRVWWVLAILLLSAGGLGSVWWFWQSAEEPDGDPEPGVVDPALATKEPRAIAARDAAGLATSERVVATNKDAAPEEVGWEWGSGARDGGAANSAAPLARDGGPVVGPLARDAGLARADAALPPPDATSHGCPPGMKRVPGEERAVCVDRYEFPGVAQMPMRKVSYREAAALCAERKKRLCSEEEWEAACRGPHGASFPYGPAYRPKVCNTSTSGPAAIVPSGSFQGCTSERGLYDMAGNVAEWIAEEHHTKGGSARDGSEGRCSVHGRPSGERADDIGFRCCADPSS
jgi:hypothetical protein